MKKNFLILLITQLVCPSLQASTSGSTTTTGSSGTTPITTQSSTTYTGTSGTPPTSSQASPLYDNVGTQSAAIQPQPVKAQQTQLAVAAQAPTPPAGEVDLFHATATEIEQNQSLSNAQKASYFYNQANIQKNILADYKSKGMSSSLTEFKNAQIRYEQAMERYNSYKE